MTPRVASSSGLSATWCPPHDESSDAMRAYQAQLTRHKEQLRIAEELGYQRGLKDGRAEDTRYPPMNQAGWHP